MTDYECGVCGSGSNTRWLRCDHPGCPDGRDQISPRPRPKRRASATVIVPWLGPVAPLLILMALAVVLRLH